MDEEKKEHLENRKKVLKKLREIEANYIEEISKTTPGGKGSGLIAQTASRERSKQMLDQLEQIQRMIKNLVAEIEALVN